MRSTNLKRINSADDASGFFSGKSVTKKVRIKSYIINFRKIHGMPINDISISLANSSDYIKVIKFKSN